jgi:predicted permease
LSATPLVTAIAVLSLALGIGANTALFSIVNGLILRPLPVRDPGRLVLLDQGSWTNPIWEEIRTRQTEIADGAFAWAADRFDVSTAGTTDPVDGLFVSGRMFEVLGVAAVRGRPLTEADDVRSRPEDAAVAEISYGFWQRRYGGAADVIGRRMSINRMPFTIVGVTPLGFEGPDVGRSYDVAVPLAAERLLRGPESALDRRMAWWLNIMLRLQPGQSLGAAMDRLRVSQPHIREATLPAYRQADDLADYLRAPFTLVPAANGRSSLRSRYERPLTTIMIVVGMVLLIACANIANLMMARAVARRHELSVRLALGASRFRLARQLFVESVLLTAGGAALGMLFANWGSRTLVAQLSTPGNPVHLDLSLDWRVLAFTTAVAVLTALLFGLAPAIGVSGLAPNDALKDHGRGIPGGGRMGFRSALVVMQVALSLTLVVAAGLFTRTFAALVTREAGFDQQGVLIVKISLESTRIARDARTQLFERLRQAAASLPGVRSAATSFTTPVSNTGWNTRIAEPASKLGPRERMSLVNAISPGWFDTYGIRLSAGRDFDWGDRMGTTQVAIVNRTFARRFLKSENPIGLTFAEDGPGDPLYLVVGLVEDSVYRSLRSEMMPTLYLAMGQRKDATTNAIGIRIAAGDPLALAKPLADALNREEPNATLSFLSLADQVGASLTQERLVATLSAFFGALALVLAALGLYGVASYAVNRRRTEIGIRMALGANSGEVVRLVLVRLGWLVGAGLIAGAGLSLWATRFMRTLLYGLEPHDPVTFACAAVVLALVGGLAGWLPARRASRIDPTIALREG